jgi:hypothetical protein
MTNKNSIKKKAQASLEYMSIFGIAFVLIALTGGAFFAYTSSAKTSLDQDQINKIGTELLDDIQKIYFFGDTNRRTYKTTFPQGIQNLSIHHINESGNNYFYLNFTIIADGEFRDLIFQTEEDYIDIRCKNCTQTFTSLNENISTYDPGRLGQGFKNIRIEAINNSVYVDFVD